jgi:hypothetical protein
MQLICSILALAFMNITYMYASFNMDLLLEDGEDEIEEIAIITPLSEDFGLTDILDLDIFDFDSEELAERNERAKAIAIGLRGDRDLVAG